MKSINSRSCIPTPCAVVPEKVAPVFSALAAIGESLDALEKSICAIGERLDPVLEPAECCKGVDSPPLEHGIYGQLNAINRRITQAADGLHDMRSRLTI